jgi:hypothetical protein
MSERCFFFGCWNDAGHYLFAPRGQSASRIEDKIVYFGEPRRHIDGSLAPRKLNARWSEGNGKLCWAAQGNVPGSHVSIEYNSEEYPQGQFLLHHLDNGFTAIQWWDRCQGDTRGACNSTVLLEGVHTSEEMIAALKQHFPHVLVNLERGGPDIEQMRRRYSDLWRPPENQGRVELVEVKK